MKIKKMIVTAMAMVMLMSLFAMPASAGNNTDSNFEITISSGTINGSVLEAARIKMDSTASYVNYTTTKNGAASTGPVRFEAFIYGCPIIDGDYVDCSSYTWNGLPRTKAIVAKGTKGFIRQDVYEKFGYGSYGIIGGTKASSSTTGTAKGCWSVDSVGSYPYYNALA